MIGDYQIGVYRGALFLGWAFTFGILWRLRASQPTNWAGYPAVGLLAASILAFLMGESFEPFLPAVVLLVIGVVMVSAVFLKRGVTHQPTS
jgi:CHASE2 domain-containing sensor protein